MEWVIPGLGRGARLRKLSSPSEWATKLYDNFANWSDRRRERLTLGRMSDHMLSDIGLSRADAIAESAKAFWQE